ncbi:MAG: hypothetical protein SNJ67_00755 [Chloracidobacterium sp.]|uniref:Uncharacterized protein n=1 Tax=Chloracidobacterium validum TaxID=2821543 RepID=A0ABX8B600_9BACT|nr:hypothetical protein [Chloracidobacterium validum]QUW02396.1 hypothetical protein J8C06_08525 [Chloracidobacterium validum]
MSKELSSDARSGDAPGISALKAATRSGGEAREHEAREHFEAYVSECVERLFAEVGTRIVNSFQQTVGRLLNIQSRSIDVMEKMEVEQRYMRAQIERLTTEVAALRRGLATPRVTRSRRPWTHRHRRLFVTPRPRLPKAQD